MRIAVTYENGVIVGEQIVDTNGSGHGALAGFLQAAKVDALICGHNHCSDHHCHGN